MCVVIVVQGEPNLLQVVFALNSACGFSHLLHRRQQQRDQNSNHHQQLDESEPSSPISKSLHKKLFLRVEETFTEDILSTNARLTGEQLLTLGMAVANVAAAFA